jgi:hypothetical protein
MMTRIIIPGLIEGAREKIEALPPEGNHLEQVVPRPAEAIQVEEAVVLLPGRKGKAEIHPRQNPETNRVAIQNQINLQRNKDQNLVKGSTGF